MLIDYDTLVSEMHKVPAETRAVVLRSLCESIERLSGLPTSTEDETRAALESMTPSDEVLMMRRNFEALAWLRLEDATEPDSATPDTSTATATEPSAEPDHTSAAAILQAQAVSGARASGVVDVASAPVDAAQLIAWGIRSA